MDTASPCVEVDTDDRISYAYSKLEPFSGLTGRRMKCSPNMGTRMMMALADLSVFLPELEEELLPDLMLPRPSTRV